VQVHLINLLSLLLFCYWGSAILHYLYYFLEWNCAMKHILSFSSTIFLEQASSS
jgi:hypothetical protein